MTMLAVSSVSANTRGSSQHAISNMFNCMVNSSQGAGWQCQGSNSSQDV